MDYAKINSAHVLYVSIIFLFFASFAFRINANDLGFIIMDA